MSSAVAAHYQSDGQRWAASKGAGMIGAVMIQNPRHMDIPWPRLASSRFQMTMQLANMRLVETTGEQIAIRWNAEHAEKLLAGTNHTLDELVTIAEEGKQLPRFALPMKLKVTAAVKRGEVESQNIAAIFPGSDPKLKGEYVVMSAHIDHLGVGQPINGDSIYNGAMDNASGVASMLEVADHLKEAGVRTSRSILLVAVTGEEKGLLGSRYFAAHPTVPAKQMVADINVDMFLPLYPLRTLTVYGLEESTLGEEVRAVAKPMESTIQSDPEPSRNIFIRSDQYNFVRNGVPSVLFKFGNEKGSKEAEIEKKGLPTRYP